MSRLFAVAAFVIGLAGLAVPAVPRAAAPPAPPTEVRALWVARTTLVSPAAITRMVRTARDSGFNTLLVQVRGRGDAYFRGGIEPRAVTLAGQPESFDPLHAVLAEAHHAGLRVHAWVNVNLVASVNAMPSSRAHLVFQHPEWLMVPRSTARELRGVNPRSPQYLDRLVQATKHQASEVEGLYMSPIPKGAADYVAALVGDLAARYAVDGIHLDYVRYPSDEFDYSSNALSAFAETMASEVPATEAAALRASAVANPSAWAEAFPERWRQFRRSRLTSLVERVRAALKAVRPRALMTAAVVPEASEASGRRLQDWRQWLEDGTLDVACPMAYAPDLAGLTAQIEAVRLAAGERPFWAGIGAYRLSPAQTIEGIRLARRLGAAGIILFSYDSLAADASHGQSLAEIGRAAFGSS